MFIYNKYIEEGIWDWIKNNWGKLLVGGAALAGGAYLASSPKARQDVKEFGEKAKNKATELGNNFKSWWNGNSQTKDASSVTSNASTEQPTTPSPSNTDTTPTAPSIEQPVANADGKTFITPEKKAEELVDAMQRKTKLQLDNTKELMQKGGGAALGSLFAGAAMLGSRGKNMGLLKRGALIGGAGAIGFGAGTLGGTYLFNQNKDDWENKWFYKNLDKYKQQELESIRRNKDQQKQFERSQKEQEKLEQQMKEHDKKKRQEDQQKKDARISAAQNVNSEIYSAQ